MKKFNNVLNSAIETIRILTKKREIQQEDDFKTNWKSIYVITIIAFVSQIQDATVIPNIWNYMQEINPSMTETTYGIIRGLWSLLIVLSSIVAGFLANRFAHVTFLIITGHIFAIVACVVFFCIEIFSDGRTFFLVLFQILSGIAVGSINVYKVHIAMASSESDRAKAIGFATFAPAFGYLIGALLQAAFTQLKYPGPKLLFGVHLNLYTAPAIMMFILYGIAIILIITLFDGKMRIPPAEIRLDENAEIILETGSQVGKNPYDKVAVIIMLITRIVLSFASMNVFVIVPIYMLAAFEWTSSQSVLYISIVLGTAGVFFILFVAGYVFVKLGDRIPLRIGVIISIVCFFLFHLISFQWPFYDNHMNYKHPQGQPATTKFNETINFPGVSNDSIVGCNIDYKWCESTPVPNMFLFIISITAAISIGVPMMNVNMDTLYSRILGPIKQGTLTGIYIAFGDILNIIGPYLFTLVYEKSGPRWIWVFEVIICSTCLVLWGILYKRMIPYSELEAKRIKKQQETDGRVSIVLENI